jgi:type VI secretion system secreted protein VgrG
MGAWLLFAAHRGVAPLSTLFLPAMACAYNGALAGRARMGTLDPGECIGVPDSPDVLHVLVRRSMSMNQDTRICKVTSSLGEDALFLTELDAYERVSGPFRLNCRFFSGDDHLDFAKIIGQGITLEVERAKGEARFFNGLVARFAQSEVEATGATYHAQIVPWFWFLTRRTDCRIFQDKSVVQILEKVFGQFKQIADYKLDFEGSYEPIPYCVQYRESDFHFASRLMEEWGIGYYFEHTEKAHKMVLFDAPSKIAACPGQSKASFSNAAPDPHTAGHVSDWSVQQEFRAGAYALTDYNYRDPGLDLGVQQKTRNAVGGNEAFEIFDYPGSYQGLAPGDDRARLRMEGEECASHAIHGNSSCYGFTPGYKFDLAGHVRDSFNDTFLLTEVHHTLTQSVGGGRDGAGSEYRNSFVCIPHAIPYRPPLVTPKPVVQGVQTATVVGEPGKEIDIDELGCVYVKFHWDRYAKGDASSSCRIRVSEGMAGKGWGTFHSPRIGQEVIVEFLEGDPDRPIITGRVYNAEQVPPYGAGGGVVSGLKSKTHKGSGSNEISMDDTAGKEKLTVHGQHDMDTTVEHDQATTVHNNRTTTVDVNDTENIGAAQTISIKSDQKTTIGAGQEVGITASQKVTVGAGRTVGVTGADKLTVGAGQTIDVTGAISITSAAKITLAVGGSGIEISPGGIKITSGGPVEVMGAVVKVNG